MSKASQYIILCEDSLQEVFVRKILKKFGVHPRAIHPVNLPKGRGSGEQHVRTRYASEIEAYRARQSKAETVLIVVIDADGQTVENRQSQLGCATKSAGIDPRASSECIVHLIPRRHIETWLAFLDNCNDVNETTDYKPRYAFRTEPGKCRALAEKFADMFRHHQPPPDNLPSLKLALEEMEILRKKLP